MLSRTEAERLAAMGNALRPDWPIPSLITHIQTNYSGRAYRDVACALAYVGTDPTTQNPGRMLQNGPWWRTTEESRQIPVGRTVPCTEHPDEPAGRCPHHKAECATPEQIAAARQRARDLAANPPKEEDQ